jgi:hypothetical protein
MRGQIYLAPKLPRAAPSKSRDARLTLVG